MKAIGKVVATEKVFTTIDEFGFWTDQNVILNPFDVVKVEHIRDSVTFAVIEEISHITDSYSFLSSFISNDFGDVDAEYNTMRVGMNYVKARVVGNTKNVFIPVHSNSRVYLADKKEIMIALGLDNIKKPLVCGYLEMYENVAEEKVFIPVDLDSRFLIGPEGAHLNISGISGLAAKTSYAMFLLKSIQDKCLKEIDNENGEDVAFVLFNVKGKDLLAIDEFNDFCDYDDPEKNRIDEEKVKQCYKDLGLNAEPFKNVKYLYPCSSDRKPNTYLDKDLIESKAKAGQGFKYRFEYQQDKENIDLLFSNIDDSTQTMDSILNYIINGAGGFGRVESWSNFLDEIKEMSISGSSNQNSREITVQSWRKFQRIIGKAIRGNELFGSVNESRNEVRLVDKISEIEKNDVYVVDIARLSTDMQAYVFGNAIRKLYDMQLGEKGPDSKAPSKIVIFIDELNKFASSEVPKNSPILKQIIDIAERGRSLGIVLFGAEQFRSAIHQRVTGNCSTSAYGRTNAIEVAKGDYRYIPNTFKSMMTRLKQGEYIIQNPIFRSLLNIKFPKPIYKQYKS